MIWEMNYLVFFKPVHVCCGQALTSTLLFNSTICGVRAHAHSSSELSLPLAYKTCELKSCSQNELPPGGFPKAQPALIT